MTDRPPSTLSILDPDNPPGFELVELLAAEYPHHRVSCFSTYASRDHRLISLGEQAALLSPLREPEELAGSDVVVTCGRPASPLDLKLRKWFETNPEVRVLDLSQPGLLGSAAMTVRRVSGVDLGGRTWLHLPEPGLAGPLAILDALHPLDPFELNLTVLQPCSGFGQPGIEELAIQGRARLSGETPPPAMALPSILAFDVAPASSTLRAELGRQMAVLRPDLITRIQVLQTGVFFGHTSSLMVRCRQPVRQKDVRTLLGRIPGAAIARNSAQARPSQVVDQQGIVVYDPFVSQDWIALWALADGSRVFGPRWVLEILAALIGD